MISDKKMTDKQRFDQLYPSILVDGNIMYIGRLLEQAAKRLNDHTAIIFEDQKISYTTLYKNAVALSNLLFKHGIKPHDRVLLLIDNSPEFYVGYFAILQIGAVVAPLNVFLKERELEHIIKDSQAALIITTTHFLPMLEKAQVALPPVLTEKDFPAQASVEEVEKFSIIDLEPHAMAALLYTSGTTGLPKGVMLSSSNIMHNVLQGISRFDLHYHDRIFGVLPLFHSFAQNTCIWTPMFIGSTVILVPKIDRRAILKGLEQKPTVFLGIPALYGLMCLLKTANLDSVRCFISGADALPDRIRAAFQLIYRRKICNGYGLTEASPFVSGSLNDYTVAAGDIGRPLCGIEVKIADEHGNSLPNYQIGALCLKGPNIMLGYYNEPEMTHKVLVDGWLNTGDLAYLNDKGSIVIAGRLKDLIIHKGFNIYPPEIENIIMSHPNVLKVGVVGKPDGDTEIPVAFVQIKQSQQDIEKQLKELCIKNLASYKVPREFHCSVHELPATATGKVDKKKLRADLIKGTEI